MTARFRSRRIAAIRRKSERGARGREELRQDTDQIDLPCDPDLAQDRTQLRAQRCDPHARFAGDLDQSFAIRERRREPALRRRQAEKIGEI